QAGEAAPDVGEPVATRAAARAGGAAVVGFEGADLHEELDAVAYRPGVGLVDEGEVLHVAQPESGHLEDDRGERGAQDLRLGDLGARLEVGPRVEPDRNPVGHAAASSEEHTSELQSRENLV